MLVVEGDFLVAKKGRPGCLQAPDGHRVPTRAAALRSDGGNVKRKVGARDWADRSICVQLHLLVAKVWVSGGDLRPDGDTVPIRAATRRSDGREIKRRAAAHRRAYRSIRVPHHALVIAVVCAVEVTGRESDRSAQGTPVEAEAERGAYRWANALDGRERRRRSGGKWW